MSNISNKKNYVITMLSGFGGTFVSTLIGFISVPIALNYWKTEKYGLWALLSSILVYLSMSNLGLNASASVLMAKNSNINVKFKILKRAFSILIISIVICLTVFLLLNFYNQNWIVILGKFPDYLMNEAFFTCLIMGIFFFVNLPFSLVSSLYQGFQRAYIENFFSTCLTIVNFISLLIIIQVKGNLILFAIINGSTTLVFNILKATYFYFFIFKNIKSNSLENILEKVEREDTSYKMIFITGIRFFLIGIAAMVVWNTDNLVISNFLGIEKVTPYAVTFKLYYILFNLIFILNTSILPVLAKEFGNNNWEWINKVYEKLLIIITIFGGLTWVGGIYFLKDIVYLWTGPSGYAGIIAVLALGGYSYLLSMVNLNAGIINSFNYIKGMPLVGWLEALLNIGFSIFLLKYFGIGGVALGTFLGSLLSVTWILPYVITKRSANNIKYNKKFVIKHFVSAILPILVIGILAQLFVESVIVRLSLGMLMVIVYLLISYKLIPKDTKEFIKMNISQVYDKVNNIKIFRRKQL